MAIWRIAVGWLVVWSIIAIISLSLKFFLIAIIGVAILRLGLALYNILTLCRTNLWDHYRK